MGWLAGYYISPSAVSFQHCDCGTQTGNMFPAIPPGTRNGTRGISGYTRDLTDMSTVFYALGPGQLEKPQGIAQ